MGSNCNLIEVQVRFRHVTDEARLQPSGPDGFQRAACHGVLRTQSGRACGRARISRKLRNGRDPTVVLYYGDQTPGIAGFRKAAFSSVMSVAEVETFWRAERRFEPKMPAATRERFFGESKAAVTRARG
jgi:hypothetical protein